MTEIGDSDFKNAFPGIFNFTVGILDFVLGLYHQKLKIVFHNFRKGLRLIECIYFVYSNSRILSHIFKRELGDSDTGDFMMVSTIGNPFKMSVTKWLCWRLFFVMMMIFQCIKTVSNIRHQHRCNRAIRSVCLSLIRV